MFTVRLNDTEYERLEREAERRQVPMGELFRDMIKALDRESEPSGSKDTADLRQVLEAVEKIESCFSQ